MKNRSGLVLLSLAVSLAAVACSGPESPSSPASTAVSPANTANGSDGAGTTGTATSTVTGTIRAFGGSCPALTFTLEGKTIKTNATTSFRDVACTALKNDVRVTVVGTTQADGSVLATTVRSAPALPVPPPPAPVPPTATSVTIAGTIHNLVAGCPILTFTLETKTIKTSAATSFGSGTCAALANDMRVTVVGTTQGDGSVLATEVRR
jgi:hypothetical protein